MYGSFTHPCANAASSALQQSGQFPGPPLLMCTSQPTMELDARSECVLQSTSSCRSLLGSRPVIVRPDRVKVKTSRKVVIGEFPGQVALYW